MGCCHGHRCGPPWSYDYPYDWELEMCPPRRRRVHPHDDLVDQLDRLQRELETVRRLLAESGRSRRDAE